MQYVLTEEEYKSLLKGIEDERARVKDVLGDLCKRVACSEPLTMKAKSWDNKEWIKSINGKPWGCIHVEEHDPGYCDKCPVQKACPLPKDYSK